MPMSRMNSGVMPPPRPTAAVTNGPMGWREIHDGVRELRRTFALLFVKTPTDVTFRNLGPNLIRCYFLSSPGQGRECTLYYADINLDPNWAGRITSQEVLQSGQSFLWRRTSKEEQLLSERRRTATWGITNYELHPTSGTLVFPASSTIFQCVHPDRPDGAVNPRELTSSQVRLNPQICPANPNLIAFSARSDIYIYNTATGEEKRVSHTHSNNDRLEYNPKSAGVPSYVMQEEFSRYQGYWWQPYSTDGVYRLLYEEIDESEVPIVQFISPDDNTGMMDDFRFPRAGMPNAESTLRLLEVELSPSEDLRVTTRHLRHDLKVLAPWYEYLVRVGWTPDGSQIWCQLLNRRQQRLELILVSLSSFTGGQQNNSTASYISSSKLCPLPPHVILSHHSRIWIDVHNLLYWWKTYPDGNHHQRKLIFASEEAGYRHLYLYVIQLTPPSSASTLEHPAHEDQALVTAQLVQKVALTSGNWSVCSTGLWVDEANELVYFTGLKDTPLEQHLYVTSLQHPGVIHKLTASGYSHQVSLNDECSVFVTVFSNVETPSQSQVFKIHVPDSRTNNSESLVWVSPLGDLISDPVSDALGEIKHWFVPEIFTSSIKSGDVIYSMVFKPHNFIPGCKYPTVLNIYGGPQVQQVTNTFKGLRHMRTHMLAAHGFVVISIDSRGSDNRGVSFQAHLHNRMGTVEIEDQVEVLQLLAQRCDFIDLSRVAVFGWSYGGYMSLMALAQRPDFFKLSIAGAPVVSWSLYDTGYTERYMDLPSANATGYRNGSVLTYINGFPDQENRLLIVQGMIDENVHFSHTNQLVQALIKAGKPYQLQIYPRERHSLRQLESHEHYETKLLSFLLQHL